MAGQRSETVDLAALADEHAWITSVDGCCHCGDSECDGIGCIANIDPDDERDHPALENLHELLRQGRAWRVMQALRLSGADPMDALVVAAAALEHASNVWPLTWDPTNGVRCGGDVSAVG